MNQDVAVYEKVEDKQYKIKIGSNDFEEKDEEWLESNWKRILNFSFYTQLKKQKFKRKICFHCEKEVKADWITKEMTHIICPLCDKETGLWDCVEDVHKQKEAIKKVADDIDRTKNYIDFDEIKPKNRITKGTLFEFNVKSVK